MIKKYLKYCQYLFRKITYKETTKKLGLQTENEKVLINELRSSFKKIPVLDLKEFQGPALQWAIHLNRLRELILNNDVRRFLQWDVIRFTMFVGPARYVLKELEYIKTTNNFDSYWKNAIIESNVGLPITFKRFDNSSGNLIHHAYHLQQFEEKMDISINKIDFVFEFGGGYGSFCRLFNNLGFKNKYVIFDLPSFSILQKYYLKSLGYNILTVSEFNQNNSGILCISDFEELKEVLKTVLPQNRNLFIGKWSISEAPMNIRTNIIQLLENFNLYLFGYQDQFGGINNLKYFKDLQNKLYEINWSYYKIEHLPDNNYLFGKK